MTQRVLISPQEFYRQFFGSRSAQKGEVIRRRVRDVERFVGRGPFLAEARRRGYAVFENAGQFVVFCNAEEVVRLV